MAPGALVSREESFGGPEINGNWFKVTGAGGQEGGAGPVGRSQGPGDWPQEPGNIHLLLKQLTLPRDHALHPG